MVPVNPVVPSADPGVVPGVPTVFVVPVILWFLLFLLSPLFLLLALFSFVVVLALILAFLLVLVLLDVVFCCCSVVILVVVPVVVYVALVVAGVVVGVVVGGAVCPVAGVGVGVVHSFHCVLQDTITPNVQARGLSIDVDSADLVSFRSCMPGECFIAFGYWLHDRFRLCLRIHRKQRWGKSIQEGSSAAKARVNPTRNSSGQSPD